MKPINIKLPKPPQSSFKYKRIRLEALKFNWHFHPEYEIMLMVNSRGKRFIGDSISYYKEGDLFFIGPNLPHTWYSPEGVMGKQIPHEAILIQFIENFAGLNVAEVPELQLVNQLFANAGRGFQILGEARKKCATMITTMETMDGPGRLVHLLSVLDVLSKAPKNDCLSLSSVEFRRRFQPEEQSRIDQVCTYINQNYIRKIPLEEAANIASMSTTAFSRFFKKSTGKTFVNYVNDLRIGRACKLLIESDLSVAEICYEVGFNNLSNFNRRFYERHEISPREYRHEFSAHQGAAI